ncbi:MAG: host attachment protein [Alphaproteobacteria bacterium]
MRSKSITSWIAIADGAKARIFSSKGPRLHLELVGELNSEKARQRASDLTSDRQGRVQNRVGTGSAAMEAPTDPQAVEKTRFTRELVSYLEAADTRGDFDALVLVAPPRTLGEVRKLLPGTLAEKVSHEVGKDLTNSPPKEVEEHLLPLEIGKPKLG